MAGTEPKMDRQLLGRVAALTSGQRGWLRPVLQTFCGWEAPAGGESREEAPEGPRPAKPKTAKPAPAEEPRRQGLDNLLSGEGAPEEEDPELADELKGVGGKA